MREISFDRFIKDVNSDILKGFGGVNKLEFLAKLELETDPILFMFMFSIKKI